MLSENRHRKNPRGNCGQNRSPADLAPARQPTKLAYKGYMPNYIINKMKTGWSVPLIYWISSHKNLNDLAMKYMKGNDCLKNVVGMDNWDQKKTKVVSWMMRTWAKSYCMELKA